MFLDVFNSHEGELVKHYGITSKRESKLSREYKIENVADHMGIQREALESALILSGKLPSIIRREAELDELYKWLQGLTSEELEQAVINYPKARSLTESLSFRLIHKRLAIPLYARDKYLGKEVVEALSMNSRLAFIYMNVLAERMASVRLLHPVADDMLAHLAVNGYTLDRLIQALLESDDLKPHIVKGESRRWYEIETQMATVALKSVLPQNIASVPSEKIIKLRKKHHAEMMVFQNYIHEFAVNLEQLQTIDDPIALQVHLETEYEKKLKPQLDELKKMLRSLGIDTAEGLMNIRVGLPPFLATTADYLAQAHAAPSLNPIVVGAGALALSVFPVIRQKRRQVKKTALSTPAAYLLYAQEGLEPARVLSQVSQHARQILYGI